MTRQIVGTLGALIGLLLAVSAPAAIYKWTDEKGKVQYSQTPPAGATAVEFTPIAAPPGAGRPDESLKKRLEGFDQRRESRKQSEADRAAEEEAGKIRAQNCQRARDNLNALQHHGRVSIKEGDTYRALPEEERQARIAEAQAHVDTFCKQVAGTD